MTSDAPRPQQVINRLGERWFKAQGRPPAECKLGRERARRRGGACSACSAPNEFDIDRTVAQLITSNAFKHPPACPYRVISSHLVTVTLGSEAARARGSNLDRVDPIRELKAALRHIRAVLRMTTLSSEDIEALIDDEDDISDIKALKLVVPAERNLRAALQQLNHIKPTNPRRGRTGELKVQAVVRAMARAWRVLTGRLPAKDNARFHDLLSSATATVFGDLSHQPNWESATETARKRIQRGTASGS